MAVCDFKSTFGIKNAENESNDSDYDDSKL